MRLNASPSRNFAHVRIICNATRARSSFLSEVFWTLLFTNGFTFSGLYSFDGKLIQHAHPCKLRRRHRLRAIPEVDQVGVLRVFFGCHTATFVTPPHPQPPQS